MITMSLLTLLVGGLLVTAVRKWFLALCGLMFLTVLMQHPDMPTQMLGIPGLNPWNLVLAVIFVCWIVQRRLEPPPQPTPQWLVVMVALYVGMVVLSGLAAVFDVDSVQGVRSGQLSGFGAFVDTVVNPLKYAVVGLLFFMGVRNRSRLRLAMVSAVLSGMCYALLMFKSMKLRIFTIDFEDARRLTDKLVGLFANDLGQLFAFTVWAAFVLVIVFPHRWQRSAWLVGTLLVIPPFLSLKSRAGYLAALSVGLALGVVRWRWILVALPVAATIVVVAVPSVLDRVMTGYSTEGEGVDWDAASAGRVTELWPAAIDQIGRSPLFGEGQYAILRTQCYDDIVAKGVIYVPSHPHNAYLEILLDAGIVGLLVCLGWLALIVWSSIVLLRERDDPLLTACGTMSLAAVVTLMSAGVAGSSFLLTQSTVVYACVWGAVLRAWLCVREKARRPATAADSLAMPQFTVERVFS